MAAIIMLASVSLIVFQYRSGRISSTGAPDRSDSPISP